MTPIELAAPIHDNIEYLKTALRIPDSGDGKMREFEVGGASACLFYIDGMAGQAQIDDLIMQPCRLFAGELDCAPEERGHFVSRRILSANDVVYTNLIKETATQVLEGKTALILDGCGEALIIETRNYEKRPVGKTIAESVVMGPQQGFVENLRTNITLIRRIIKSAQLTSEIHAVGVDLPVNLALVYLNGACNETVLSEMRRRILSLGASCIPDIGHLQQLIEDRPFMLIPQTLLTERPDRAAYMLADGYIAIIMDNSPYALIAPVSLFDFMFTADDSFVRWQYSTFNRIVRYFGLFTSLLLPGLYISLAQFHTQMVPIELLSSIAEARSKVPFPVIIELLIMEISFYLINEAGTRMPSQIGSALGIVGALILGQAAVSANIISPIMIIIAALSGLGNYAIPDYGLSIAVQIMRLVFLLVGATMGIFGMSMVSFLCMAALCSMHSFGQPYMAPRAPWRPNTKGMLFRRPLWMHNRMPYFVPANSWLKRTPIGKKMRNWEGDND